MSIDVRTRRRHISGIQLPLIMARFRAGINHTKSSDLAFTLSERKPRDDRLNRKRLARSIAAILAMNDISKWHKRRTGEKIQKIKF